MMLVVVSGIVGGNGDGMLRDVVPMCQVGLVDTTG